MESEFYGSKNLEAMSFDFSLDVLCCDDPTPFSSTPLLSSRIDFDARRCRATTFTPKRRRIVPSRCFSSKSSSPMKAWAWGLVTKSDLTARGFFRPHRVRVTAMTFQSPRLTREVVEAPPRK